MSSHSATVDPTDPDEKVDWLRKLSRPIGILDGPMLHSLADARAYLLDLPQAVQGWDAWQRTAELLLAAAEGSADDVAATEQLARALFLDGRLRLEDGNW